MDELFGGIDTSPESEPVGRNEPADTDDETVADVTAADVFDQLRTEVDVTEADSAALLEDETPLEIIESADEPAETEERVDDDLLADEGELESLLLPGRTEGENDEFLWVETPGGESAAVEGAEEGRVEEATTDPATDSDTEPNADPAGSELDDDADVDRADEDRSSSISEEVIEAFTEEGPGAASEVAAAREISQNASPAPSGTADRDDSGESSTGSSGRSNRRGTARTKTKSRRKRSKSEKAGGLYAKLRSKLSDVV